MTIFDIKRNCSGELFINKDGKCVEILPARFVPKCMRGENVECVCPPNCQERKERVRYFEEMEAELRRLFEK